jgi:branched-chain amino acid transport system ATP-binding protein
VTAEPLLSLNGVEVVYNRIATAVQGVSMAVARGSIVALLGANGAGKTTTLRAISGFIGLDHARITQGGIAFAGQRIENLPPETVTRLGIVLVPERDKVFENLSVSENLMAAVSRHVKRPGGASRMEMVFSYFPALGPLRDREAGYLSGGERQMLGIGSALMCEPELLLIDELSLGLAPIVVAALVERLVLISREQGVTVLLVEQNAAVALEIADYGYVLENGRIVLEGEARHLLANPEIRDVYLGQGGGARRDYRTARPPRPRGRWHG